MIIGCVGFSWSGSSAVTDLLAEYDENQIYFDEFIYAYHPDSLLDLDFHLNVECSKFLSSTVAIPRFIKISNKLLKKLTKGKIKKLVNSYLSKIIQCEWIGDCQGQMLIRNMTTYDYFGQRLMVSRVLPRLPYSFSRKLKLYPLRKMQFSIKPENFINETQLYTSEILRAMGFDLTKNIVLDQPFPGNCPSHCMEYFKDSKAIIVDRDPRDMYLLLKHIYKRVAFSVPIDDVKSFITYFKRMHMDLEREKTNPNVLYIHFESLVYDYDNTRKIIESFLNLKSSTKNKTIFIPEQSAANTQLYKKIKGYETEINMITKELENYLFCFESFNNCSSYLDNKNFFDDNPNKRKNLK